MQLIGIDVGGTFTDLVYTDTASGSTIVHKVHTSAPDPSVGVIEGLEQLGARFGVDGSVIGHVLHGTTVATNAVLEHEGAVTGVLTTEGFRDVLHIGRHWRPENYSIQLEIPWQDRPFALRRHRLTVPERIVPPAGDPLVPLDEDAVRAAASSLRDEGVESVAVCFLFSYLNPDHENRARELLLEEMPDAFVVTSAMIAPQFREFERFTTAAMTAFVGPRVRRYMENLAAGLEEASVAGELHIMGSHGGVATAQAAAQRPIMTLMSGPAAGVLGGAWAGALSARDRLITFDVGGTSADIGIVIDGEQRTALSRDTWIAGYPVLVPMLEIATIGAGGGSIASVDEGGSFNVGPRSAGSTPGPAAYANGGTEPTVTDANLVLGRLDPQNFLGGEMPLDAAAADRVIAALAGQLDLEPVEAAEGVLTILNANMANAIRARTVQKGLDPRDFALVAFGGAGPLHGAEVAAMLDIPEVIVPPHPGITSATGLLTTDLRYEELHTAFQLQGSVDLDRVNADFDRLEHALLERHEADGFAADDIAVTRSADVRYLGQGYELRASVPASTLDETAIERFWADFHEAHQLEYGHSFPERPIEIVNIRVVGVAAMPKIGAPVVAGGPSMTAARIRDGTCLFRVDGRLQPFDVPYFARDRLPLDTAVTGPAIVLQRDTTTVVPPRWRAARESSGNIVLTRDI